ncbi:MAG: HAMP domain-containing sensor histidine kinase [Pseudomonadota bacterium]
MATNRNRQKIGSGKPGKPGAPPAQRGAARARAATSPKHEDCLASSCRQYAELPPEERLLQLQHANAELRARVAKLNALAGKQSSALAELETELKRRNVDVERLRRARSEFISIAAHELRTPMTSIVGYLDLIVERRLADLPGDLHRPVTSLQRNAHRLRRLIEDMLDVNTLSVGSMPIRRAPCSLTKIVRAVIDELEPVFRTKRLRPIVTLEEIAPVDADSDRIHRVVLDVLANITKYLPDETEIGIAVDQLQSTAPNEGPSPWQSDSQTSSPTLSQSLARLRVWESGSAIPAPLLATIFEPFSVAHTAKYHTSREPDAAGLGLSLARGIVELHGGAITVDSDPGQRTEFTVLLPLASSPDSQGVVQE